ncbi:MAG: LysR family transcriptional regulator [Lachnospiraceae bacterium]|nr:LysR family transcriptional regulator [Lachnospiraceae bacterium]
MDLRVLEYFLAVAREQSITAAAKYLHLSQPTLSTQLKNMEEELGKQLLIRGTKGSRKILLTEEGRILRKRAEEILSLVQKAEHEITASDELVGGDIYIGTGESDSIRILAKTAHSLRNQYPDIHYHIRSGNSAFVFENLEKGLIDFGLVYGAVDVSQYGSLKLPEKDTWGVLMRKDAPLAKKEYVEPEDLLDLPLIITAQKSEDWPISKWLGQDMEKLNIVASYNLLYNASLFVDESFGYAICYDKLINTSGSSNLCFRPLFPELTSEASIIWKRYQVFSKAAQKFIDKLQEICM